ncbi:MAG: DNA polymerase IV [Oligoflexia bacterium]|nr:DNA polymerase IV [Oligoflexia bacterium]
MGTRKIIHIDMDCFYAAVEVKYNPTLKGKAIAVGGRPEERSVICTASYEARKFGVKSAVSSYKALKLCPHLILIPPDFEKYHRESQAIQQIFSRFTKKIEPLSLDEAFLDVTDAPFFGGSASLIAMEIRKLIFHECALTASAGVAENKFLAKLASEWNKPNGQYVITPQAAPAFIKKVPVEKIFGVGKVTAQKLHSLKIFNCQDLQHFSIEELYHHLGSWGENLYYLCRGMDEREVETSSERKSFTVEYTYPQDLPDLEACLKKIPELYQEFRSRFLETDGNADAKITIKSLIVKIKFCNFKHTTVQQGISPLSPFPTLEQYSPLLHKAYARYCLPVRLLGLGVRLAPPCTSGKQLTLF